MLETGTVVDQRCLAPGLYQLRIESTGIAQAGRPGQFVMVRGWSSYDLLLPRPFSFHRLVPGEGIFELVYKVKGEGTERLSGLVSGDRVSVTGPFGNGFPLPPPGSRIAVVARGVGQAPMMALLEAARRLGITSDAYLSASRADFLIEAERVRGLVQRMYVQTDDVPDGSRLVTDFLVRDLVTQPITAVYTCGSQRLAKQIALLQKEYGFSGYVMLEERMACGVGACKACVCRYREADGPEGTWDYKRVCVDGPIFPVERVVF